MNISEIHVDDFGAWHDLTLDQLSSGATIFYGPNEAGKTTLLNLIRTVLYGFSRRRCQRYLPPARGQRAGGALTVSGINGEFRLQRSAPANYAGGDGDLRITSPRGDSHGGELLTTLLAGVDETIFNNIFAVGLTQMQELATLSDTDAAAQLYGLATGVDRVSLHDVMRELCQQREAILPTGQAPGGLLADGGQMQVLMVERERLQKELKALRRDAGHWTKLRQEYAELERTIETKERKKSGFDAGEDWPALAEKLRKQWTQSRKLNDRLLRIGPLADIPQHIAARLESLTEQVHHLRREWEQLREQRKRIKAKAEKLTGLDTLYHHAAEIEALDRQRQRIVNLEQDAQRAKGQWDELEFEIQAELEQLGMQLGTTVGRLPELSESMVEALREPARVTRDFRERADASKSLAEQRREAARGLKGQLEAASLRFGGEDIGAALRRSQSLVDQLERRLDLDGDSDGIRRKLNEMRSESQYWLARTVLPWSGVLAVCGVFSAGVALVLGGLFSDWFDLQEASRLPMMMIGGSVALVSLVMKGAFENAAHDRVAYCQQQIEALFRRQTQRQEERAEIDQALPAGSSSLDDRLIQARQELADLRQYVPLQQRYQDLMREADAAEYQSTLAIRDLKEARAGWKSALRAVGLPDSLTPTHIGEISGRVVDVTRLRQRAIQAKNEYEQRYQELTTVRERLDQLQGIAQIHEPTGGIGLQLDRLLKELEKHTRSGREHESLRREWEQLAEQQQRIAKGAEQLMRTRKQLFDAHAVDGIKDFRRTMKQAEKAAEMRKQRNQLLTKVSAALGGEFNEAKLQKLLDRGSNTILKHLEEVDSHRDAINVELSQLHQRRGELKQRLEAHLQDRRDFRKELELIVLDEKIKAAGRQWQLVSTTSSVLESVKTNYETKRQPVALAEASRHLERLTEGRYRRIWTPMGQNALCIDGEGQTLPVEKLSRGTRELVFLSLRLALVGAYRRRSANMPIVLDDVFVNFDDQRAMSVASVLADLAHGGQQLLVFTCHQRIRDIFRELQCDVRDLPIRTTGVPLRSAPTPMATTSTLEAEVTEFEQEPPVTNVTTEVMESPLAELPAYDAVSWDETLANLTIPPVHVHEVKQRDLPPNPLPPLPDTDEFEEWYVADDKEYELVHDVPEAVPEKSPRFQPAWRDECLDTFPDLEDPLPERLSEKGYLFDDEI